MSALPEGWVETQFSDVFDIKGGTQPPKSEFSSVQRPNDIRLLQIRDFGSDAKAVYIRNSDKWSKCDAEDILIGRYGASVGKILTGKAGAYNVALVRVIFNKTAVDPRWVYNFLKTDHFQNPIALLSRSAQNGFNKEDLAGIPLQLPPLPEQQRIVAKVDALMTRTARARKDLAHIPTLITRFKQRLLALGLSGSLTADWRAKHDSNDWLKRGLTQLAARRSIYESSKRGSRLRSAPRLEAGDGTELPKSWILCSVADVADLRVGYAFKSQWFSSTGTRLVRGANVAPGRIDWSDEKRLSPEYASAYDDYRLSPGDIVIAMDRPLISTGLKIAVIEEADAGALLVQRVANPRPSDFLNAKYMFYVFNGQGFISQIESHATGSDLPHISGNDILTTAVPLPPLSEQAEIVRRIETAFAWLDRLAAEHTSATKLLPKLDAAILTKAFAGHLVPQNPTDEPASILLARVKAEREAMPAKGRKVRA